MRMARALDDFEHIVDEQVGLPLRGEARVASHVQNVVAVNIREALTEQLTVEYNLCLDELWSECMALLKERMEKAVKGLCDEYKIEPFIKGGECLGQKLTYYKFGRKSA